MSIKRVLGIASVIFLVDQVSKFYVVQYLNLKDRYSIDVLDPVLNFRMAWNRGINFGFFDSGDETFRWVLILVSLVICIFLLWWIRRSENIRRQFCVSLIIGGAMGNVVDRVFWGAVADFLNVSCCGIQNPFSFNIADIAIFLGAFVLILWDKNDNEVT